MELFGEESDDDGAEYEIMAPGSCPDCKWREDSSFSLMCDKCEEQKNSDAGGCAS